LSGSLRSNGRGFRRYFHRIGGPSCFVDRSFHVTALLGRGLHGLIKFPSLNTKNDKLQYENDRLDDTNEPPEKSEPKSIN
jgi:hypothetical protein